MNFEHQAHVPADHPALAGHFPGNPVLPGVVILDEVVAALSAWLGRGGPPEIASVKFLRVLRPGDAYTIRLSMGPSGEITFSCDSSGERVAVGRLRMHASGDSE